MPCTLVEATLPIAGISLGCAEAAIKRPGRKDLVVMEICEDSSVAAVFTQNAFCAAPVTLSRQHLATTSPRWLLINAGNANAGTGSKGLADAWETCKALAALRGCEPAAVLPFSTGVIGQHLPVAKIATALPEALDALSPDGWESASRAIMTTDTRPKLHSVTLALDDGEITLSGMAKGSGMIHPNMATMLAFLATDATIDQDTLQYCLHQAVDPSFNSITVDGDTSTNDACVLVATGQNHCAPLLAGSARLAEFQQALDLLCMTLARDIVRDGEGATKLVEVQVSGATNREEARAVGFTIAHSPLVKTALFASDPNWGRILAAIGRAGVADLDVAKVRIALNEVEIVRDGGVSPDYTEAAGQAVMNLQEFAIRVDLGRGEDKAEILTCDFSYDYVKINAEYRT